jgi:spermidine synthase
MSASAGLRFRLNASLFLVALTVLMFQLSLVRVFDVIWSSNFGYLIITLAMFAFGLSGVFAALFPLRQLRKFPKVAAGLSYAFGLSIILILPAINLLPFNVDMLFEEPVSGLFFFTVLYFCLGLPFFFSGLLFTTIFSAFAEDIQELYFWDLLGAALGCIVLIPFLPIIGPGGIFILAGGFAILAGGLLSRHFEFTLVSILLGALCLFIPFHYPNDSFEFRELLNKRAMQQAREEGRVQYSRWDPISKIEVVPEHGRLHVAYDGGSQSTFFYPFDGDFDALRARMPQDAPLHFWERQVIVSHYLKQDTGHSALIIGSAGGQETKAALMYGAGHVDAVELVGTVVELGKTVYADYTGQIFNHPNVNKIVGEGRSHIRASGRKYDIIQMFSNHTSSSIASGTGAVGINYLQTVEAYIEYFSHLTDNGILHINHHVFPRMVITAAEAWRRLGRDNFRDHVVIFEAANDPTDTLPTFLVKMTPWTDEEIDRLLAFFDNNRVMVEDPRNPEISFLHPDFYTGRISREMADAMPFQIHAPTDNRPYFNFLRRSLAEIESDPAVFTNLNTAQILNWQLRRGIPLDVIHLIATGVAAVIFIFIFLLIPMYFSPVGREKWTGKAPTLIYFSCLGSGFIIFELVFIQLFMRLIGFPLYTYSTVVFAILLSAGIGSFASEKMGITAFRRWWIPFAGVLVTAAALIAAKTFVFDWFLTYPVLIRSLVAAILIFPLGFFLGMCFPLGVLGLRGRPNGAIAWAWAMNGLFTVVGGFISIIYSLYFGFQGALFIAMALYVLAWVMYPRLRAAVGTV